MSAPVVNIRCSTQGCRRLLLSVGQWPEDGSALWTDSSFGVWAESCSKHKAIRPRETIEDATQRRANQGLPPIERRALMVFVSWASLRRTYLEATHRGRATDYLAP